MPFMLRVASKGDARNILKIYSSYVTKTCISFEETPPSIFEMERRIEQSLPTFPWIVAVSENKLLGYAYATAFRSRAAYQWSVETSVYLDPEYFQKGFGMKLYRTLIQILKNQGFFSAYAGIALPNPSSIRLHEKLGFLPKGIYTRAGFKLNQWVDISWWQLELQDGKKFKKPLPTKPLMELKNLSHILNQFVP
ncbi:MAG: N-acetyltransferase [SAR324 cluster bacterium]|nr:N-acetyltransferase [SAR324 cluster bacterium]